MQIKTALILCAGLGKRLNPLTSTIPKPLLELNNVSMLENCINILIKLGIKKVLLNTFHLRDQIFEFIKKNKYQSIPKNVVELAKKHILDGFGLALSGSVARTGDYLFKHIKNNSAKGRATVIGSKMKVTSRFAALANGTGIHSDDYDDTQLAVQKDRVYGLLTHPTAPCLPSAFAEGELKKINGKAF